MLTPKALLLLPAIAGSLAFNCGGDARPAASADSLRPTPSAAAPAQTSCPSEADVSRIVGITLKRAGAGSSCVYMSDDQESSASLMLRGAASGDQLIKEAREEAEGRQITVESPGFGDRGAIWSQRGTATGAVVGNGKSAYVVLEMPGKEQSATKAALLALLRKGIE